MVEIAPKTPRSIAARRKQTELSANATMHFPRFPKKVVVTAPRPGTIKRMCGPTDREPIEKPDTEVA